MSDSTLSTIRNILLGATGMICLFYAVGAIYLGRPNPIPAWIPGVAGALSGVFITLAALRAGPKAAGMAMDEGYTFDNQKAQRISYWVALALYPSFGLLLYFQLVAWPTAFAAMGTLTGASYLLLTIYFDVRGRL